MYPRTNYEMSEQDLAELLEACKPTPVMFLSGGQRMGGSPQENANDAWSSLGTKMGFDHMTVRPIDGKSQRFFTAVPAETGEQRADRVKIEARRDREQEIIMLNAEIAHKQKRLAELEEMDDTGGKP
jgi:hypothetical protein